MRGGDRRPWARCWEEVVNAEVKKGGGPPVGAALGSALLSGHSLPGSSVHGILQTRILEWVAISFSKGSSYGQGGLACFNASPVPP